MIINCSVFAKGLCLKPAGFEYPPEYNLPDAKRLRIEEGGDLLSEHPELAYPNTDFQYADYYQQQIATASSASTGDVDYSSLVAANAPAVASKATGEDDFLSYYAKQAALSRLLLGSIGSTESTTVEAAKEKSEDPAKGESAEEKGEANAAENEGENEEEEEEESVGWQRFKDESTGAYYYFNSSTGESSWQDPNAAAAVAETGETEVSSSSNVGGEGTSVSSES